MTKLNISKTLQVFYFIHISGKISCLVIYNYFRKIKIFISITRYDVNQLDHVAANKMYFLKKG